MPSKDHERLHAIGDRLGLPAPERTIPGHDGRSHVALYADTVLKVYAYKPELNRSREVDALRRWADTGLVPRLLACDEGAGPDQWTHMTRTPGVLLAEVRLDERPASVVRDVGRALGRLHTDPAVREDVVLPSTRCTKVYGHGDFGARNVLVEADSAIRFTGLIDVEKSQPVCFAADLAMYLMKTAMGEDVHWESCLDGYLETAHAIGPLDLGPEHLDVHLELFARWASRSMDAEFAARARAAVTSLSRRRRGFR